MRCREGRGIKSDAALVCCLAYRLFAYESLMSKSRLKVSSSSEEKRCEDVGGEDVARGGDVDGHRVEGLRRNVESARRGIAATFATLILASLQLSRGRPWH